MTVTENSVTMEARPGTKPNAASAEKERERERERERANSRKDF